MKSRTGTLVLLATAVGASMLMSAPAQAGRRTGTWKYSPEAIYEYQRAQAREARRNQWGRYYGRPPYGNAYGYRRHRDWDDDY